MISRRTPVTVLLLLVIAAVWGAEVRSENVIELGANLPFDELDHQYWRFVTSMFLHANWPHVLLNGLSLAQMGGLFESLFGSRRFALVYFASGLVASIASSVTGHVSVGASGAIFGIAGAVGISILRTPAYERERWLRNVVRQLIVLIPANLVILAFIPMIDNAAHIGGLVAGLLLGFIPHGIPPPPPSQQTIDV